MTLSAAGHESLAALFRRELTREEDPATARLMARVRAARRRGFVSRGEFLAMCRWKSPRALRLYDPPRRRR